VNQKAPVTGSKSKQPTAARRWFFHALAAVHSFVYRRGLTRKMGKMPWILLTTTGRKSGQPHTVPVGAIREADGWVVIGSFYGADVHPSWWMNLLANPDATIQVNDQQVRVRMQEVTDPADRERIWNTVVATMNRYANYAKKTSRVIPLGWLRPV
jgi:deazaflavin-dependent oxidoreductase (nitroreductase family)